MAKTKDITFNGTFLSANDRAINIDDFKENISEGSYTITEKKRVHIYSYTYYESYLKVILGDGSAMPRNPNVYDTDVEETMPNPRQPNQAELRETFGLIDFNKGFLWLSDSRKRKSLIDFFHRKLKKLKIVSKDVYDEQKFIETLSRLDDIRVSAVPNIFSQTNVLTKRLAEEINGYEASVAKLHFHYDDKFVGDNLSQKIKNIIKSKSNFDGIVISGRDERNLGMLFDSDGFSRKIEFKALVDENEMFLADDVFTRLITKIEDEKN